MMLPTQSNAQQCVQARLQQAASAVAALGRDPAKLSAIAGAVCDAVQRGKMVFTCGNGGSAAEAMHLAEELVGRYRSNRAPLRAVCLNADPTALTCIANDFGFESVFSRQVEGLAVEGDLLVVFSTSGKSPNVLTALAAARKRGVTTVGLLGEPGSPAQGLCDHWVVVSGVDSAAVQEAHQMVVHIICETLEPVQ